MCFVAFSGNACNLENVNRVVCTGLAIAVTTGPRRAPALSVAQTQDGPLDWKVIDFDDLPVHPRVAAALNSDDSGFQLLQVSLYPLIKARLSRRHAK